MAITKTNKDPTRAERKLKKRKLEEAIPDLPGDVGAADSRDPSTSVKKGQRKASKKRKLGECSTHGVDFQQGGEKELQKKKTKEGKIAVKDSESHADEIVKTNDKALDSDHIGELRSGKLDSIHDKLERKIEVPGDSATPIDENPPGKKSKKERKAERKAAEAAQAAASDNSASPSIEDSAVKGEERAPSGKSKKNNRNREKKRKRGNINDVSERAEGKTTRFIVFIGKLYGHFACSCN